MKNKAAPLPHEWMLISIMGFFISWLYVYGQIGSTVPAAQKWGAAFMLLFILLFIASMISITRAGTDDEDLEYLSVKKHK